MIHLDRILKRSRSGSESQTRSDKRSSSTKSMKMNESQEESNDQQKICFSNSQMYQILNDLRKNNHLCDGTICAKQTNDENQVEFPIHRFVVAASSPYLRMIFRQMKNINNSYLILNMDSETLESLLDFIYTRQCRLTLDNVMNIIEAAKDCQIPNLSDYCCEFLSKHLNHQNIFHLYYFAQTCSHSKLFIMAYEYLMYFFVEIVKINKEFLELTFDQLNELISNDDLNIRHEEYLFDLSIQWIDHDRKQRKSFIGPLLAQIRLGLIPLTLLTTKIKENAYVKENNDCKSLIGEVLRLFYDFDRNELKNVNAVNKLFRPRHSHEILFVFGGWSGGNATNILEAYDVRTDRWTVITSENISPRAYHGCLTINDELFIIGGFDGNEYFNSCRNFHLIDRVWKDIAPMNERRCYVSVTYLNGFIYAMGGFNGHVRQNTAEKYQSNLNQWSMISPMHVQRSDASACALNNRIYICGGFDGQECLQTAEYYDPATNQWTLIKPMQSRRSGVGVIAYHGLVYAVGGFNGTSRLNTAERYSPTMDSWRPIVDMLSPRSNFAIEIVDDLMFTIGGFNGVTTIANVECYDDATDEWYDLTDMNLFRSALSACVVNGIQHAKSFLYSFLPTSKSSPNVQSPPTRPSILTNTGLTTATPFNLRLTQLTLTSLNQSLRNLTRENDR